MRIEDTEDWLHVVVGDLSLNGAFLLTDQFIVEGTRVDVGFEFPSGSQLFFLAEIVRAADAAPGQAAGLGITFVTPAEAAVATLASELSQRMGAGAMAAPPPPEPHVADGPAVVAGQALDAAPVVAGTSLGGSPAVGSGEGAPTGGSGEGAPVGDKDLTVYEQLRLPPNVDDQTLQQHFETMVASLRSQVAQYPEGSEQRERALIFQRSVERLRPLTQDARRRASYDFHNGFIRAEARIAAATEGRGLPLKDLRKIWTRVKPKEAREAKRLAQGLVPGVPDFVARLERALELDPFNETLQHEKQKAALKASLKFRLLASSSGSGAHVAAPGPSGEGAPITSSEGLPVAQPTSQESGPVEPPPEDAPAAAADGGRKEWGEGWDEGWDADDSAETGAAATEPAASTTSADPYSTVPDLPVQSGATFEDAPPGEAEPDDDMPLLPGDDFASISVATDSESRALPSDLPEDEPIEAAPKKASARPPAKPPPDASAPPKAEEPPAPKGPAPVPLPIDLGDD